MSPLLLSSIKKIKVVGGGLFLLLIFWHLLADAPTINLSGTSSLSTKNATSIHHSDNSCTREGVIIVNVVGRLANDLFEVAFANRLSQELCGKWHVLYRPFWGAELPNARGTACFPKAHLPLNHKLLNIPSSLQAAIHLNASTWKRWALEPGQDAASVNDEYHAWISSLNHSAIHLKHMKFDFRGNGVEALIETIHSSPQVQVISLQAFFIHYDWMKSWMPRIREWLEPSSSCCHHEPPDNAVVIHVRDFDPNDGGYNGLQPSAYIEILQHYNFVNQPLWIVCQPFSVDSHFVQALVASAQNTTTIVTGVDQYDAFCTLTRAKTLVLSYVSSFSQMAALLSIHGDNVDVHYPLTTLDGPKVTLAVPSWRYHLVNATKDGIQEWNVGFERIQTVLA